MEWNRNRARKGTALDHHLAEAYEVFYRIENTLRVFVYAVLKAHKGSEWMGLSVKVNAAKNPPSSAGDSDRTSNVATNDSLSLSRIFKKSRETQRPYEYLGLGGQCPLLYLTMFELLDVIEVYPEFFSRYFPGRKIPPRLKELVVLRNEYAHFRTFTPTHLQRVKECATVTLGIVEEFVGTLMLVGKKHVAPNTDEAWYHSVTQLSEPPVAVGLFEHGVARRKHLEPMDGRWVTLCLNYEPSPIQQRLRRKQDPDEPDTKMFLVPNIRTPAVMAIVPKLVDECICVREHRFYEGWHANWMRESERYNFGKRLLFTFALARVEKLGPLFGAEIETLCTTIKAEIAALAADSRYRTSLIELEERIEEAEHLEDDASSDGWSWAVEPPEQVSFFPPTPEDCAEYWGELFVPARDYLSHCNDFPWAHTLGRFHW